jgi:hypothetical protein
MKRKIHHRIVPKHTNTINPGRAAFILTAVVAVIVLLGLVVKSRSASADEAAADITVSTAISPNTNSLNWGPWAGNAIKAIQSGQTTMGDPTLPSYYKEILPTDTIDTSMVVSSSNFRSWYGKANPENTFGSAFATEQGNTLRFVFMLKAKPETKINISNGLTYYVLPNAWKPLGLGPYQYHEYVNTPIQPNYLVGVDYGADGTYGGGDDTIYNSGTAEVDAIIGTFTTTPEISTVATTYTNPQPGQSSDPQTALDLAIQSTKSLGYISNVFQITYSFDPAVQVAGDIGIAPTPTPTNVPSPTSPALPTNTPTPAAFPITIDIRPNADKNNVNLKSRGLIGVAILSSSGFNPKDVDSDTVLFAGASPVRVNMKDVNKDKVKDMVLYFKIQQLQLDGSSVSATLTGSLKNGTKISGSDMVTFVPKAEEVDEEDMED